VALGSWGNQALQSFQVLKSLTVTKSFSGGASMIFLRRTSNSPSCNASHARAPAIIIRVMIKAAVVLFLFSVAVIYQRATVNYVGIG